VAAHVRALRSTRLPSVTTHDRFGLRRVHWAGTVIPLPEIASECGQCEGLLLRFDPFRNDLQAKAVREYNHCADDLDTCSIVD